MGRHESPCGLPWEIIENHYGSLNFFKELFAAYERRVARIVQAQGIERDKITLSPVETRDLFDTWRMRELIDNRVRPLRNASHAHFRDNEVAELYDTKVSRIYHELSILKEEHLSVRDFPRELGGGREFARLFREVSTYYPERLSRVNELFERATNRLEELLPQFADGVIVLRSAYLFRDEMWPEDPQAGLVHFLDCMYPDQGAVHGFLVIARSFLKAGFLEQAAESARLGAAAGGKEAQARSSRGIEVRETISELDRIAARAQTELKALAEETA